MPTYNTDNEHDLNILIRSKPTPGLMEYIPRREEYGSPEALEAGLEPVENVPDILLKPDQYRDAVKVAHEHHSMPLYHAQIWRPPGFKYNQNGIGYCHTEDTEVLTQSGWITWGQVNDTHLLGTVSPLTHALEFQRPIAKQVFNYNGPMIYSTNKRLDFGVTPAHRMLVRKWNERTRILSQDYTFTTADHLGWYCGLMAAPSGWCGTELIEVEIPGDRRYDGDDFVALLAMIISDGFAGGEGNCKTKNLVSFACFTNADRARVAALAHRVGFQESPSRPGVWQRWNAGALATWLRVHCYTGIHNASGKRVPNIIKELSERQIKLFLLWYHDQLHAKPMLQFFTTSSTCAGDIQELLLRIGKRATLSWGKGTNYPLCTICVSQSGRLCLDRKKHLERDHYRGNIFCATVPNGTLVTRRNGSVLISGNCWTWGGTGCMMTCRAAENRPLIKLAPVSMGYLVNWADQGNYLESYMRGAREQGVCPSPDGNINSLNRSEAYWKNVGQREKYRLDKVWDTRANAMTQHCVSILCYGRSLYVAYNFWGHALELVGVQYNGTTLEWILSNSHNEADTIKLTGSRAIPSEAYAFVSTVFTE